MIFHLISATSIRSYPDTMITGRSDWLFAESWLKILYCKEIYAYTIAGCLQLCGLLDQYLNSLHDTSKIIIYLTKTPLKLKLVQLHLFSHKICEINIYVCYIRSKTQLCLL
jgi:hypothetical protein